MHKRRGLVPSPDGAPHHGRQGCRRPVSAWATRGTSQTWCPLHSPPWPGTGSPPHPAQVGGLPTAPGRMQKCFCRNTAKNGFLCTVSLFQCRQQTRAFENIVQNKWDPQPDAAIRAGWNHLTLPVLPLLWCPGRSGTSPGRCRVFLSPSTASPYMLPGPFL